MFTHPDFDLFVLYLISVLAIPLVLLLPNTLQLFGLLIVGSWAYLVKTIPETLCVHWIWYLRFYYNYSTAKMQTFPVILLSVDEIYFLFLFCLPLNDFCWLTFLQHLYGLSNVYSRVILNYIYLLFSSTKLLMEKYSRCMLIYLYIPV